MKGFKIILIIILLIGFAYPLSAYTLTVRVFNYEGTPIEGARVKVAYDAVDTNAEGIAIIEIPQQYTVPISVLVTKEGYESYGAVLNPPYPSSLEVTLYSEERGPITGTVFFDSTDNPAGAGYTIEIFDAELNTKLGIAVTDTNSRFVFEVSVDRTCFLVLSEFPETIRSPFGLKAML